MCITFHFKINKSIITFNLSNFELYHVIDIYGSRFFQHDLRDSFLILCKRQCKCKMSLKCNKDVATTVLFFTLSVQENVEIKVQVKIETSKTTRTKRPCPLPFCKSQVIHLPRHLQDVHGWSKEHSRTALTRFGMRKTYTFSDPGKVPNKKKKATDEKETKTEATTRKDYHKYRYCPLHGCTSLVKRIPAHLKNFHHMDPASEEYRDALSRVRGAVKESYMKLYHERPRARFENECCPVIVEDEEEDENEDQEENASSIQSADSTTPKVIFKFETWLKSADGGNLDDSTSKQHRAQISKLLKLIDNNQDLASLFNEQVLNEKFLEGFAKKEYHPKTTKSYLMSLRHFYSFCLTEDLGINIPTAKILSLKEKMARWSSSLCKGCSKRHWEKMEEDLHSLKDPSQARLCYCFDLKFAIKLLVERDKTSTVQLVKV